MDGKILVMKLREAGLSQGFFTRKRNIDSAKELKGASRAKEI